MTANDRLDWLGKISDLRSLLATRVAASDYFIANQKVVLRFLRAQWDGRLEICLKPFGDGLRFIGGWFKF